MVRAKEKKSIYFKHLLLNHVMTAVHKVQQTLLSYTKHLMTELEKMLPSHPVSQLQQPTVTSTLPLLEHQFTDQNVFIWEKSTTAF